MKKIKIKYSKLKSYLHYLKPKNICDSGFCIIFGERGAGKSTRISKDELAWEKQKKQFKGYKHFYSNLKINTDNPNYHYLDLTHYKLTDYIPITEKTINAKCYSIPSGEDTPFKIEENSIIEIDELAIVAHSRDYKNFPKEFIYLVAYLRHLGLYMIGYSQSYNVDKILREGASELRIMRKIKLLKLTISRRIRKRIICEGNKKQKDKNSKAEEQIHDELSYAPIISSKAIDFTFIPFYTDRFNSYE